MKKEDWVAITEGAKTWDFDGNLDEAVTLDEKDYARRENILDEAKKADKEPPEEINYKYEPWDFCSDGVMYGGIYKGSVDHTSDNYVTMLIDTRQAKTHRGTDRGNTYLIDKHDEKFKGELVERIFMPYEFISAITVKKLKLVRQEDVDKWQQ